MSIGNSGKVEPGTDRMLAAKWFLLLVSGKVYVVPTTCLRRRVELMTDVDDTILATIIFGMQCALVRSPSSVSAYTITIFDGVRCQFRDIMFILSYYRKWKSTLFRHFLH